jgi:hypothetical protein
VGADRELVASKELVAPKEMDTPPSVMVATIRTDTMPLDLRFVRDI